MRFYCDDDRAKAWTSVLVFCQKKIKIKCRNHDEVRILSDLTGLN